jgi:hypothetical protein
VGDGIVKKSYFNPIAKILFIILGQLILKPGIDFSGTKGIEKNKQDGRDL